jgi:phosphoglycolate phosphatase
LKGWESIRCVAFDFDGTLVESNAIKRGTYFEVLEGVSGATGALERTLRENPRADRTGILAKAREAVVREGAEVASLKDLVAAYSSICERRVIECASLPGAPEALEALHPTHALYLASATPEDALERVVAGRGWSQLFRGVYGGPRSKPENLTRIAERECLSKEQMLYVGDGVVDRDAAVAFGCAFLGCGTPAAEAEAGPLTALVREIAARIPSA